MQVNYPTVEHEWQYVQIRILHLATHPVEFKYSYLADVSEMGQTCE